MSTNTKFPLTNLELIDAGGGQSPVFFPASFEEYWELLPQVEYRIDFYNRQIIATMSYESDLHSQLATRFSALLIGLFPDYFKYRVYNSNRPVFIKDCPGSDSGVFNPDGMVVTLPVAQFEYKPGVSAETTPVFLIEILSKSTRKYDFGTKLPCYKTIPGLQQILFIEQDKPQLLLFEREAPNRWTETELKNPDDVFLVQGQAVSLAQVYRGVL